MEKLLEKSHYSYIEEWYNFIDAGNKQGIITADEAQNIIKTLSLKSYSGGHSTNHLVCGKNEHSMLK